MFLVVVAAPIEVIDFELEAPLAFGQSMQYLDSGRYDLRADPVAGSCTSLRPKRIFPQSLACIFMNRRDAGRAQKVLTKTFRPGNNGQAMHCSELKKHAGSDVRFWG